LLCMGGRRETKWECCRRAYRGRDVASLMLRRVVEMKGFDKKKTNRFNGGRDMASTSNTSIDSARSTCGRKRGVGGLEGKGKPSGKVAGGRTAVVMLRRRVVEMKGLTTIKQIGSMVVVIWRDMASTSNTSITRWQQKASAENDDLLLYVTYRMITLFKKGQSRPMCVKGNLKNKKEKWD
jgi:hypothetical protein